MSGVRCKVQGEGYLTPFTLHRNYGEGRVRSSLGAQLQLRAARLTVGPPIRRTFSSTGGVRRASNPKHHHLARSNSSSDSNKSGGEGRVRTCEGRATRFTVWPRWPLGYLTKMMATRAGGGDRTPDPRFTKPLLYQLSYTGESQYILAAQDPSRTIPSKARDKTAAPCPPAGGYRLSYIGKIIL